jgi:hypothetical protein
MWTDAVKYILELLMPTIASSNGALIKYTKSSALH